MIPRFRRQTDRRPPHRTTGANTGRRISTALVSLLLGCTVLLGSCDAPKPVQKRDVREFRRLVGAGLDHRDPFVRAETLRVLGLLESARLAEMARGATDDDSPMVRVAAVRTLLASSTPKANSAAKRAFAEETGRARRTVLEAVVEHGSDSLARTLLSKAIDPSQPADLRRWAFEHGLAPRARRAMQSNNRERYVENLFVPNMSRYVRRLDPELAGPILRLFGELGVEGRAKPVIETFRDDTQPVERRLRAARILREGRVEAAQTAFRQLLARAWVDPNDDRLRLPSRPVDDRLVRAATLGLVATGSKKYVPRAKLYLREAKTDDYIEVLEALAPNPADGARLALESAMLSARMPVRHRAIELYAKRPDARAKPYLDILRSEEFEENAKPTRRKIAVVLSRQFPDKWTDRIRSQLTSSEGMLPGLRKLKYVVEQTDAADLVADLRAELIDIARSEKGEKVDLAVYLLTQLRSPGKRVRALLSQTNRPLARYSYLEHVVTHDPGAHVDFLRKSFYPEEGARDWFATRLLSGAGLWRVRRRLERRNDKSGKDTPSTAREKTANADTGRSVSVQPETGSSGGPAENADVEPTER
ncbi:MAG: HEAT repeat domain-containing protein [Bradymonadaceae bacterium]